MTVVRKLPRQPIDAAPDLLTAIDAAVHDITNLLGVVLNYTTLLARQVSDPVAIADLGQIRAAAQEAADRTQQLLASVRESGQRADAEAPDV